MGAALVVRDPAAINPAGLGDKQSIAAIRDRIMSMIPGAQDAPADVVWAAAQLAVAYRLDPFNGEIYIMKIGSKKVGNAWVDDYRAHVGVKGLRKKAREQALFMTKFRQLSDGEVKAARRSDYDAGDVGYECSLYRMDIMRQCQMMNVTYEPFVATGFWRVKAKKKQEVWEADNIPNTWTAKDVAEKRAEINAIKRAYDLNVNVADPSLVEDDEVAQVVGRTIHERDRDGWMPAQRPPLTDFDEQILDGSAPAAEAEWSMQSPAAENEVASNPFDDTSVGAEAEKVEDYGALADTLTGDCKTFAVWAHEKHRDGDGPSTAAQYNLLAGTIDKLTVGQHRFVLSVLCRRFVCSENPCSKSLANKLLDFILKSTTQKDEQGRPVKIDGKPVYMDNPKYSQKYVDCLKEIAQSQALVEIPY